ncbi:MAG: hypothetical protein ABGF52_07880 [Candidatus Asgardarchaeum sp.]|nr:hypothetical protein [Candidatus Odinarchaeota archaeon]
MTKIKVDLFTCPVCMSVIDYLEVDLEETEKVFLETGKPVPVIVTCPNGHALIVYVYINIENNKKRALIRQVKSAIAVTSSSKENTEKEESESKNALSKAKNWLEGL